MYIASPHNLFQTILSLLAILCLLVSLIVIVVKPKTLDNRLLNILSKLLLIVGTVTAFSYVLEALTLLNGTTVGRYAFLNKVFGKDYGWAFWLYLFCTGGIVQVFWLEKYRVRSWVLPSIAIVILLGIRIVERYVLVFITLIN